MALAAVVGIIPDETRGETIKVFIKLKSEHIATQEEIILFCKDKMASYKRPRIVAFTDEIPLSNVGKVLRRGLK